MKEVKKEIKQIKKEIDYKNNLYLVKRLSRDYIFPHYKVFAVSIFLMIVIAVTTAYQAYLVKPALDEIFVNKNVRMLVIIPLIIFGITVIRGFATYFQLYTMNFINLRIMSQMRKKLYSHFINSDISTLHSSSSGEMISKIMMEVNAINGMISTAINGFVKQLFTVIFLVALMFHQSLELAFIAFVGFPLAAYPIYKIGKKLRHLSFANQGNSQKFVSQMDDTLQYSKLVKSYNCEEFEVRRMSAIIDNMEKLGRKISRLSLVSSPMVEMLGGVGVSLVIWYGGHQVLSGNTTPGAFFSFFTAMMMAYKPLKAVSGMNSGIQLGLGSTERFYTLIDNKPKIVDKPNAAILENVKGNIIFKNVGFNYLKDKVALNGINLEIGAGQTVALVGHSGGGKSTIMNMILRFYDPKSGYISIDGKNIKDITVKSLRASISVVNQEIMLFDDSIIENIRYGKEGATEEEIIRAAKMAEADEFIQKLDKGYQTQIGQNGIRLSGGQRQRIAIARAILYDSPILLLDEATSALDPISEHLVKNALKKLMKGRTTVVIAHRLSTVMHANKICVVSDGRIVESGTHVDLLEKNGAYANLYHKQFEIEEDN